MRSQVDMPKLPPIKTLFFIKFLLAMGCTERKIFNGSHNFYTRKDLKRPITVITSNKEISGFAIKQYLNVLGYSEENFLLWIKKPN